MAVCGVAGGAVSGVARRVVLDLSGSWAAWVGVAGLFVVAIVAIVILFRVQ